MRESPPPPPVSPSAPTDQRQDPVAKTGGHVRFDESGNGVDGYFFGDLGASDFVAPIRPATAASSSSGPPRRFARSGDDVDDPSGSSLQHSEQNHLRDEEKAVQVDGKGFLPFRFFHPDQQAVPAEAGVVDEDKGSIRFDHRGEGAFHRSGIGHIEGEELAEPSRLADLPGDFLRRFVVRTIVEPDVETIPRQGTDDGGTDPLAAAGDQRDIVSGHKE
jgi:hypothetical protein